MCIHAHINVYYKFVQPVFIFLSYHTTAITSLCINLQTYKSVFFQWLIHLSFFYRQTNLSFYFFKGFRLTNLSFFHRTTNLSFFSQDLKCKKKKNHYTSHWHNYGHCDSPSINSSIRPQMSSYDRWRLTPH